MTTEAGPSAQETTIFTIGFTKKSARQFFGMLQEAGVRLVVDIRLNNESQLAGFTKKEDLGYFLKAVANIDYVHRPDLAPSKEILDAYKKKQLNWADYERRFLALMIERKAEDLVSRTDLDRACLLCSEPKADKCHRRLVAEYLRSKWGSVQIRHLPEERHRETKSDHPCQLPKDG